MFLGLILAGTMMSFTSLEAETVIDANEDLGTCCTAIQGGNSVTVCGERSTDSNCRLAEAALAIIAEE